MAYPTPHTGFVVYKFLRCCSIAGLLVASSSLAPANADSAPQPMTWQQSSTYREFTRSSIVKKPMVSAPPQSVGLSLKPTSPPATAVKPVGVSELAPTKPKRRPATLKPVAFQPDSPFESLATLRAQSLDIETLTAPLSQSPRPRLQLSAAPNTPALTTQARPYSSVLSAPTKPHVAPVSAAPTLISTSTEPAPSLAISAVQPPPQPNPKQSEALKPVVLTKGRETIYRSPEVIVRKERIVYASSQQLLPQDFGVTLSAEDLAELDPANGENDAVQAGAPIIQLPNVDPNAIPTVPVPSIPTVTVPSPAAVAAAPEVTTAPAPDPVQSATPTVATPSPLLNESVATAPHTGSPSAPTVAAPLIAPAAEAAAHTEPTFIADTSSVSAPAISADTTTAVATVAPPLPVVAQDTPELPAPLIKNPYVLDEVIAPIIAPETLRTQDSLPAIQQTARERQNDAALPSVDTNITDNSSAASSTEPEPILPKNSKEIAQKIPSGLDTKPPVPQQEVDIDRRYDTSYLNPSSSPKSEANQSSLFGVKMEVKKAVPINWDYEIEKAYNALVSGNTEAAVAIYQNILANDAQNKHALFGLATTFHRAGQLSKARELYAKLLNVDPTHRDGLNNFLVLMADESPREALKQLEALEKRNPDFSPIPAQMAVIYQKLGNPSKAAQKMFRAVGLAPENLTYRYNLAILMDKQGNYQEASKLYRQILQAHMRGEVVPGNIQKLQQRLTFIGSNQ